MELAVIGLMVGVIAMMASWVVAQSREIDRLHVEVSTERALAHSLMNRIIELRREGFDPNPDTDPLEIWSLDNEHELEVEKERREEKDSGSDPEFEDLLKDF